MAKTKKLKAYTFKSERGKSFKSMKTKKKPKSVGNIIREGTGALIGLALFTETARLIRRI